MVKTAAFTIEDCKMRVKIPFRTFLNPCRSDNVANFAFFVKVGFADNAETVATFLDIQRVFDNVVTNYCRNWILSDADSTLLTL